MRIVRQFKTKQNVSVCFLNFKNNSLGIMINQMGSTTGYNFIPNWFPNISSFLLISQPVLDGANKLLLLLLKQHNNSFDYTNLSTFASQNNYRILYFRRYFVSRKTYFKQQVSIFLRRSLFFYNSSSHDRDFFVHLISSVSIFSKYYWFPSFLQFQKSSLSILHILLQCWWFFFDKIQTISSQISYTETKNS